MEPSEERTLGGRSSTVLGFSRTFLSRQEWVYVLSLLIPFVFYDLALKAATLSSSPGVAPNFYLMRSNAFFDLGYVLLWIGLFVAAPRKGPVRRSVVVLFHAATVLMVIVITSSYQYFQLTGTTLNYRIIALWLPDLKEVGPVLMGAVPLAAWALLLVALVYVTLGPWLLTYTIGRWRGWDSRLSGTSRVSFLIFLGLWLLAFGLGLLSLLLGADRRDYPSGTSVALVRQPFVNVLLTGFEKASASEADDRRADPPVDDSSEMYNQDAGSLVGNSATHATLATTPQTQKRNVVLIHLESTRAESTTPYNGGLQTTPFLSELDGSSLLAEQYYTTVEHTSKASVSVNCGVEPHLVERVTEAGSDGIPAPCLATLLKAQGYDTVFFQSSTQDFEDFADLVKNFGYEEYYPLETMDTGGFQRVNYFGYEDGIMLAPSQQWLEEHRDKPFMAEYLLGDGHQDYRCPDSGYQDENSTNNYPLNRYLNCMRSQDTFVRNLLQQYKELGLYDDTVFVIYGDHGEGFGEHGLYVHDDVPYQEGLKVPLIIHAPGLLEGGQRVDGLSNHTDILPTVLEILGYEVREGEYPGYSLLHSLPEDRPFLFSCFHENQCLASIEGGEEYIYHYGNRPDEIFDLSEDPTEQNDLAGEYSNEELTERRNALLEWRSSINSAYAPTSG